MRRGRSMYSKRAMPLSLRVASIYAMLVAATLLVAAGLALQFTRNQLAGQVDNQLTALVKSFHNRVPDGVRKKVETGNWTVTTALAWGAPAVRGDASFFEGEGAVVAIPSLPPPNAFQPGGAYNLGQELGATLPALVRVPKAKWLNVKGRTGAAIRLLRVPITDPNGHL